MGKIPGLTFTVEEPPKRLPEFTVSQTGDFNVNEYKEKKV